MSVVLRQVQEVGGAFGEGLQQGTAGQVRMGRRHGRGRLCLLGIAGVVHKDKLDRRCTQSHVISE